MEVHTDIHDSITFTAQIPELHDFLAMNFSFAYASLNALCTREWGNSGGCFCVDQREEGHLCGSLCLQTV